MSKETDELEAAKQKIVELSDKLEKVQTPKQEDRAEEQLRDALRRLETLEKKYESRSTSKEEDEELEEDGDQCPVCGHVLNEMGGGEWYCPGCNEYFKEE